MFEKSAMGWRPLLQIASRPDMVRGALQVSAVVGTILNLINQGSAVASGAPVSWRHVALNFLVPFCVSSFSAVRSEAQRRRPSTLREQ